MEKTKRLFGLIVAVLLTTSAWAQMTFTYSNSIEATESTLADGSTFVQLASGTDLNSAFISGIKVNGVTVDAADIIPNPITSFKTDGEIETYVYDGKAYSFRFTNTQWFTAVIFADPEINMGGEDRANNISTTETMTVWMNCIINMAESGKYKFDNYPIIPTPDLVICAGDMDGDDGDCEDISSMFDLLTAKGIPFITMFGNHDIKIAEHNDGFMAGSASSTFHNKVSLECIEGYKTTAQNNGIENLQNFTQTNGEFQMKPFTFTFRGVRFYIGQNYWFQTPYDYTVASLIGNCSLDAAYPANGIIESLTTFVGEHKDEPSVWVQHYPINCQDRWWLDQDGSGNSQSITGTDNYPGAQDRRNKYMDLITQTKNPYHFSGHNHVQAFNNHTYNGVTFIDHVAPYFAAGGHAWMILCNDKDGVVEVKSVTFNE